MSYQHFKVSISNYIASVAFNRPDKANSLNIDTWKEMKQVFDDLALDASVRAIVLTGEGKHFCAGMDVQTLMSIPAQFTDSCPARQRKLIRDFILLLQGTITSIEDCKKPVLAAVHGCCIGGGLHIIAACDMRYCTDSAYFTLKEVDLGIVPDIGALQRLPQILNPGILAEIAFTGRKILGTEAKEINLVNASFESQEAMMEKVMKVATQITQKSPVVISGIKEMLLYKRDHTVNDALDYMSTWNAGMLLSDDLTQAMQSNFTKEQPSFKDF